MFPVQKWAIDGIQVWPILRVNFLYEGKDEVVKNEESKKKNQIRFYKKCKKLTNSIKHFIRLLKMETKDQEHNDYADGHRDIVFFSYSIYRKAKVNDLYYFTEICPFLSEFREYSYLILESAVNDIWRYPRYGKSMYVDKKKYFFRCLTKVKSYLSFKKNNEASITSRQIHDAYQYLLERDIKILTFNQLKSYVREINELKLFYLRILKKTTPRIVIIECYYSKDGFGLILAAKQLGIPVADIQHGYFYADDYAYGEWPTNPKGYQLLPDYFFVWNDADKESIQEWNKLCGNKHTPVVIGNQWMSMWGDNAVMAEFEKEIERIKCCLDEKCKVNILYSMSHDFLSYDIIEFIKKSPPNWQWFIRMHPAVRHLWSEFSDKFENLFSGFNVIWRESSSCSLPALISVIDLHITQSSSVALICQELGIPSIVEDSRICNRKDFDHCLIKNIPPEELSVHVVEEILEKSSNKANGKEGMQQTDLMFIREKLLNKL